jgi:hypothetical protein
MEIGVAVSEEKYPFIRQSYRGHDGKEEANSNGVDVDFHFRYRSYILWRMHNMPIAFLGLDLVSELYHNWKCIVDSKLNYVSPRCPEQKKAY